MSLTNDEIVYIRNELVNSARPLIFFDDDPDGLSSFLLFYRLKNEGKGIVIKSTPEVSGEYAKKVEEYQPDVVFILDKPLVSQDFFDACKGKKVIWLDHHAPQKMHGVKYFNPRIHDDDDNRPTSYWAYRIVLQDLWIAMAGIVGDWALPDDATKKLRLEYPDLLSDSIIKPQDALFNSKIGHISRIFSFLLKGKTTEVLKAIKILTRIENPKELLEHNTPRSSLLYKKYQHMDDEYQKLLKSVNTNDKKIIIFTYEENKMSFTADLSNELLYKYPEKLIIIGRGKNDELKLSMRSSLLVLPPMIEKALVGIEGYGGGHAHACGGAVKKKDFQKFLEQLKAQIE
jgi:single-stranded DNA-specific DHH superfamily exonuclease